MTKVQGPMVSLVNSTNFCWQKIKQTVVESINYAYDIDQRRGIITLTQKTTEKLKTYIITQHRLQNN